MPDATSIDPALPTMFDVVQARYAEELDGSSRVNERVAESRRVYRYQLQDRALWGRKFESPIFNLATRSAGSILASYADSQFATGVSVEGDEGDLFCFTSMLRGDITLMRGDEAATATVARGLAWRPGPGTRVLVGDASTRANVFLKVAEVEEALEQMLDHRLRRLLEFRPYLDWSGGLAASLKWQLDFVMREFQRPDGLAGNAVALASMTDLLITLVLRAAPHNHTDQLEKDPAGAVPAYVRRAEDFMQANSAEPIRMAQVATAAGCSMRTLVAVFRHFRGRTPLGALHRIRLEQIHAELSLGANRGSITAVARRYGFTNAARFGQAFRRHFGEAPSDVVRRASR
jgi:AraC-like DNA-binding protein